MNGLVCPPCRIAPNHELDRLDQSVPVRSRGPGQAPRPTPQAVDQARLPGQASRPAPQAVDQVRLPGQPLRRSTKSAALAGRPDQAVLVRLPGPVARIESFGAAAGRARTSWSLGRRLSLDAAHRTATSGRPLGAGHKPVSASRIMTLGHDPPFSGEVLGSRIGILSRFCRGGLRWTE